MKELIEKYLKTKSLDVRFYDRIDSTNTALRALAEAGAEEGTVLIAAHQTAGRGRRGRSFYSPQSTVLYMSILLRPKAPAQKILRITPAAAVAAAQTFEEISGESANIKWVNDVYMRGRKVCGILTEASITGEDARYVIMGIGVNLLPPEGGFPPELRDTAGSVFTEGDVKTLFAKTAAGIADRFMSLCADLDGRELLNEYRRRSILTGRDIDVYRVIGGQAERAKAEGIDDGFGLMVRFPDGRTETLSSGEVTVRKV